jgi:hypothetical protein
MFAGVNEKLECAGYFLDNLKTLAEDADGLHNLKLDKQHEMRANLDGFFFEIISAKDFFLQGINDRYKVGLQKDEATKIDQLKCYLSDTKALSIVKSIEKLLSDRDSWLWRLNNYRNSATHRELLHYWNVAEGPTIEVREGETPQFQIVLDPETKNPTYVRRVDIPSEDYAFKDTKMYLFADPEDPSKGKAKMEIIPYCEQSLTRMKELLERLYSELELE